MIERKLKRNGGRSRSSKKKAEEIKIKVEAAYNSADEVFRLLERAQPEPLPVHKDAGLQIEQGANHIPRGLISVVAESPLRQSRAKTLPQDSRLAPAPRNVAECPQASRQPLSVRI